MRFAGDAAGDPDAARVRGSRTALLDILHDEVDRNRRDQVPLVDIEEVGRDRETLDRLGRPDDTGAPVAGTRRHQRGIGARLLAVLALTGSAEGIATGVIADDVERRREADAERAVQLIQARRHERLRVGGAEGELVVERQPADRVLRHGRIFGRAVDVVAGGDRNLEGVETADRVLLAEDRDAGLGEEAVGVQAGIERLPGRGLEPAAGLVIAVVGEVEFFPREGRADAELDRTAGQLEGRTVDLEVERAERADEVAHLRAEHALDDSGRLRTGERIERAGVDELGVLRAVDQVAIAEGVVDAVPVDGGVIVPALGEAALDTGHRAQGRRLIRVDAREAQEAIAGRDIDVERIERAVRHDEPGHGLGVEHRLRLGNREDEIGEERRRRVQLVLDHRGEAAAFGRGEQGRIGREILHLGGTRLVHGAAVDALRDRLRGGQVEIERRSVEARIENVELLVAAGREVDDSGEARRAEQAGGECAILLNERITALPLGGDRDVRVARVRSGDRVETAVRPVFLVGAHPKRSADFDARIVRLQDDVHHARHRVGTVGRRCTVRENFDALDGRERDRADIDECQTTRGSNRRDRGAAPVDQHQRGTVAERNAGATVGVAGIDVRHLSAGIIRPVELGLSFAQYIEEVGGDARPFDFRCPEHGDRNGRRASGDRNERSRHDELFQRDLFLDLNRGCSGSVHHRRRDSAGAQNQGKNGSKLPRADVHSLV